MNKQTEFFNCQHCGRENTVTVTVRVSASHAETPATLESSSKSVIVRAVVEYVAKFYGVQVRDLKSRTRESHNVLARQVCAWILVHFYQCSYLEAARAIWRDNHSTTYHACRRVEARRERLDQFREETDNLATAVQQRIAPLKSRAPNPVAALIVAGQGAAAPS